MNDQILISNLDRKVFAGFWARSIALLIDLMIVGLISALLALSYNAAFGQKFVVEPTFAVKLTTFEQQSEKSFVNAYGQTGKLTHGEEQQWLYGIFKTQHNIVWSYKVEIAPGQTAHKKFSWPKGWPIDAEKVKAILLASKVQGGQKDMLAELEAIGADKLGKGIVSSQYLEFVLLFIYFVAFEGSRLKGSLGKRLLKLGVVNDDGKSIGYGAAALRNIGKLGSALILLIGFLMVIWTKKRQGLHDIFVSSFVVRKSELVQTQAGPVLETD